MSHYFLTSSIFQLITIKFWAEFIAWFHFCRRLKRIFVIFVKWKKWVSCSDQCLHMKNLTSKEIKDNWIMFIAHLHQRLRLYTIGWMNLNMVVHPHVMHLVRDVQLRVPEIIDKVHDIVDRWVKVRELVEATGILRGTVISILHEQLYEKAIGKNNCMKKQSARWVLRLLTVDHKRVWRFQNNVWRCFNII